MKTALKILLIAITVLVINSCLDSYDSDDCDYTNCNTVYPSQGTMTVKVSLTESGVPVDIYEGYYDNGILLERDTIYSYERDYLLAPEMYYTVIAHYESTEDTIHVIDGGRIPINSKRECDSNCYSVKDLTVNVKLKY